MAGLGSLATKPFAPYLQVVADRLDDLCKDKEPWRIVVYTCGATIAVFVVKDFLFQEESLKTRVTRTFFRYVKLIPAVRRKIEAEMAKNRGMIEEEMYKSHAGLPYVQRLPSQGIPEAKLMEDMKRYQKLDTDNWKKGLVSGTVYSGDPKLTEMMAKTYGMFAWTNPLHPEVFPDIRKMEAEVVRMACTLFNGGEETCGTVTNGGTESILLACLAYRNRAYEQGIKHPEMILPVTAHAAFDKAAGFFKMKVTHIGLDKDMRVNVAQMKRAINRNTCMLVASAPQFAHGSIDPVEEVAALGERYGIPVHVDSCLGGFLLPFMDKAGFPVKPFDFRLKGVTSISADTHKYGYAPKGSSVVLYRDVKLRKHQFFMQPNWPGGIYASPTLAGSRPGALIAACWATMMYIGEQGYVDATRKIIQTARYIADEARKIEGIYVIGVPEVSVVAIASNQFSIFRLSDNMGAKGWTLNALQFPSAVHLAVTLCQTEKGVADKFIQDLREVVKEIILNPSDVPEGAGAIYGMSQQVPDRSLVSQFAGLYLDACYNTKAPSHLAVNGNANHA